MSDGFVFFPIIRLPSELFVITELLHVIHFQISYKNVFVQNLPRKRSHVFVIVEFDCITFLNIIFNIEIIFVQTMIDLPKILAQEEEDMAGSCIDHPDILFSIHNNAGNFFKKNSTQR